MLALRKLCLIPLPRISWILRMALARPLTLAPSLRSLFWESLERRTGTLDNLYRSFTCSCRVQLAGRATCDPQMESTLSDQIHYGQALQAARQA